jgi:hypothetical protein
MISKIEGKKIHLMFDIGEYQPEVIDFLTLLDITSRSKATDKEIEELSEEIKRNKRKRCQANNLLIIYYRRQ